MRNADNEDVHCVRLSSLTLGILVLEGKCHAVDFLTGNSTASRLGPHVATTAATSAATFRARVSPISKYPATSKASASDAVLSSSVIAVTSTRVLERHPEARMLRFECYDFAL